MLNSFFDAGIYWNAHAPPDGWLYATYPGSPQPHLPAFSRRAEPIHNPPWHLFTWTHYWDTIALFFLWTSPTPVSIMFPCRYREQAGEHKEKSLCPMPYLETPNLISWRHLFPNHKVCYYFLTHYFLAFAEVARWCVLYLQSLSMFYWSNLSHSYWA